MIEVPPTTLETPTEHFEIWDNSKRAKIVLVIFWILIAITFVAAISGYLELELLKHAQMGGFIDEDEANASDFRQGLIGLLQTALLITSIVVFLNWFRRAYGNLHRLGVTYLKHKESMAVWSWFIPIIVFFRPVQIMNEIWTETQEKIKSYDNSFSILKHGGILIGLWWTLFVISNFIGRYIMKTAFKDDTIEDLIEGSRALLISDIMEIPEALLVIVIVYQLSKMETKLAEEVRKVGGTILYK